MAAKKTRWIILVIVGVLIVGGLWAAAFALAGGAGGDGFFGPTIGEWEEEVLVEGTGDRKIAMVPVFGEIFSDPQGFTPGASDENITSQLDQALDDPAVSAVILELDTPGGSVVPSDIIYRRARDLSAAGKPVVALMEDVAASGGYYIAAGADEIIANPATITGSIGVIMFVPNLEGTAEKLGVEPIVIKSGRLKDIGSPFRDMTQQELQIFQGIIEEAFEQFLAAVADGRGMSVEEVREVADGRIYTGNQAEELGLVDTLGDRETAFQTAMELAGAPDSTLVRYGRTPGLFEGLGGFTAELGIDSVADELGIPLRPGLKYLWLP